MAGIAGLTRENAQAEVEEMLNRIAHRGCARRKIIVAEGTTMGVCWNDSPFLPFSVSDEMNFVRDIAGPGHYATVTAKNGTATTAADITEGAVLKYLEIKNGSSRKNRHIVIGAILRHRHKLGSQHPDLVRCYQLARMLPKPPSNGTDPKPISRTDFALLLSTDIKRKGNQKGLWEALYLVSLNLAWYPIDCATCPKSAVDTDTGAVVFDRGKTLMPRVGVLWPASIQALKRYWHFNPQAAESPLLFTDKNGNPLDSRDIDTCFARRRKRAKLPDVNFADLRDGAQTRAIEEGADPLHVDILLGHKAPGVRDAYLKRNPFMVKDACAAIHRYYFGSDPWAPAPQTRKTRKGGK